MLKYSIAVIGGGPGGYVAALRAAQLGAKVYLVEKDMVGGTCLNRGCIPTKVLLKSSDVLHEIQNSTLFGVVTSDPDIIYEKIIDRKDTIVGNLRNGILELLRASGITVLKGHAKFNGDHRRIIITESDGREMELSADRFILAPGSRPMIPRIPGLANSGAMTTDDIFLLRKLPDTIIILGGGVIGVEFATFFATLGVGVTIIEIADRLLPNMDIDISAQLLANIKKLGVQVYLGCRAEKVEKDEEFILTALGPYGRQVFNAEAMLVCTGRQANIDGLGLETIGVNTAHNYIKVDNSMYTGVDGIYAVGDATGGIQLAHIASKEGEVAAEAAMGLDSTADWRAFPSCIFTRPEIGVAGLTEEQAINRGHKFKIGRFPFHANGKAIIENQIDGFVKVVADSESGVVLGVHIIGPQASVMIAEGLLAIEHGMTIEQVARTIHAHPTLEESIAEAMLDAERCALHLPPRLSNGFN